MAEFMNMIRSFRLADHMMWQQFLIGYGLLCIVLPYVLHLIFKKRRGFSPFFLIWWNVLQIASIFLATYVASSPKLTWDLDYQILSIASVPLTFIGTVCALIYFLRKIEGIGALDILIALTANILAPIGAAGVIMMAIFWLILKLIAALAPKNDRYKYDEFGNKRPGS